MLSNQKSVAASFILASALALAGCGKSEDKKKEAAPTPSPQQTQAMPATVPAGPHKDTADEKKAKLGQLEARDKATLADLGYTATAVAGQGRCLSDGHNDGSGWHGTATGLSYAVTKEGKKMEVCVSHHGGVPTVGQAYVP